MKPVGLLRGVGDGGEEWAAPLTHSVPEADGGVPDLREVLSEQAALREPVETVLRLPLLPGVFGGLLRNARSPSQCTSTQGL